MMDTNTMCDILRNPIIILDRYNMAPMDREVMREIANHIEQQEKYAELGRLAVQGLSQELSVWHCHSNFNSDLCKWYRKIHGCEHQEFCQKRAELLVEG